MHFTGPSISFLALAAHLGVLAAPAQERSLLSLNTREATANVPKQVFNPKTDTGILSREFLNPRGNENNSGNGKVNSGNGNDDSKGKKNNNGNNKDDVAIQIKIQEQKKKNEEIIVIRITEVIQKNKKNDKEKDNRRKNAYKNKNKDKNTTIIVVTVIVEIRNNDKNGKNGNNSQDDENNKNGNNGKNDNSGKSSKGNHGGNRTWYAKHTLRVNNGAKEEQTVQITDYQTTYLAQNTGSSGATASGASAVSGLAAMQTIDPNAPFQMNNGTELVPQASGAPTWSVVQPDPAQAAVTGA